MWRGASEFALKLHVPSTTILFRFYVSDCLPSHPLERDFGSLGPNDFAPKVFWHLLCEAVSREAPIVSSEHLEFLTGGGGYCPEEGI